MFKYSNVQSMLILAAFRITRVAIDDDPCQLCLHVVVLNRREEEEGAGLDREYWERVNQVREGPLNFLFQGKTVNSVTLRSDNALLRTFLKPPLKRATMFEGRRKSLRGV